MAILAVCLAVAAASVVPAQSPQTVQPYRAGIDVVQLDVSVLDRNRQPVMGLTANDFTIYEDGVPQPLMAFDAVNIPRAVEPTARWLRDANRDVVTNDADRKRVVVIVLDDAFMPIGAATATAQRIARDVVDHLGDSDWAAVTFTGFGQRQDITRDRLRLFAAIDSLSPSGRVGCAYRGKFRSPMACVIDTLVTAAQALSDAPQGRKTLVFISAGPPMVVQGEDRLAESLSADAAMAMQYMLNALRQANVNVYAIDPEGLRPRGLFGPGFDTLRLLAEQTGGRTTTATNTPWEAVPQIFQENSSYYLLGFRSTNPGRDGSFRTIRVAVNRPGVEVRTRSGYHAPLSSTVNAAQSPLDAALRAAVPGGTLPLGVTLAPFARPGARDAAVAVALALLEPISSTEQMLEIVTLALDSDCGDCRKLPGSKQTVMLKARADTPGLAHGEVLSRLNLPPGHYEIRVAATLGERAGGVFAHLDIPRYVKDRLSASGLVLSTMDPFAAVHADVMADVIPVVPTAVRAFPRHRAVTAFLRIYQGGSSHLADVNVGVTILDERDVERLRTTTVLPSAEFGRTRSADFELPLPLADLEVGAYLLVVNVKLGELTIRREVRFSVSAKP